SSSPIQGSWTWENGKWTWKGIIRLEQ
nr:Chain B, APT [Homo sapiens]